jgi:hypothetical protein
LKWIGCPITNMIMELTTGIRARVIVNKTTTEEFQIERGTPQGSPLSPILFAIVIEMLNRSINSDEQIEGIKLKNKTTLKLLLFADDAAGLTKNSSDRRRMKCWWTKYQEATSSKVNNEKSKSITFNETEDLNFQNIPEEGTRYLGFELTNKGLKNPIKEQTKKIQTMLENTKKQHLPMLTRATILKTYGWSKLWFLTMIYKPTKEEIQELNNIRNWFLFSTNSKYNETERFRNNMKEERLEKPLKKGA